jgi:hypothetical protein
MPSTFWWLAATVVAVVAIYFVWVRKPASKDSQKESAAGSFHSQS